MMQASSRIRHLPERLTTLVRSCDPVVCFYKQLMRSVTGASDFPSPPVPPPQLRRLEGKVAIITGAASGIGETAARLFTAHGARTVIADVQDERGEKLAVELGNMATFVHCDVTKEEDVSAAVDKAASLEGKLDIVYCNAGILGAMGPIDELPKKEFENTLGVNLTGTVLTVKHAARVMKPIKRGSIVCTGSIASVVGGKGPHSYTISKSAIIGLVKCASVELRAHGIRLNMVSPDGVATPLFAHAIQALENLTCTPELVQQKIQTMSLLPGRCLNALDVAQAALFLASDESGYISGHNLLIDCGNSVTKANETVRWYTTSLPMIREDGKTGLD